MECSFFHCYLSSDMFYKKLSGKFCLRVRAGLSTVSEMVLNILLPFCAMYLCKAASMIIKIKILINSEKH